MRIDLFPRFQNAKWRHFNFFIFLTDKLSFTPYSSLSVFPNTPLYTKTTIQNNLVWWNGPDKYFHKRSIGWNASIFRLIKIVYLHSWFLWWFYYFSISLNFLTVVSHLMMIDDACFERIIGYTKFFFPNQCFKGKGMSPTLWTSLCLLKPGGEVEILVPESQKALKLLL